MTKYHVSENGTPVPCTASVRACPLGEDVHGNFDSAEDANRFAEKINQRRASTDLDYSASGTLKKRVKLVDPGIEEINDYLAKTGFRVQDDPFIDVNGNEYPFHGRSTLVSDHTEFGPYGLDNNVAAGVVIDTYLEEEGSTWGDEGYRVSRIYSVIDEDSDEDYIMVEDNVFIPKEESEKLQGEIDKAAQWLHSIKPQEDLEAFKEAGGKPAY